MDNSEEHDDREEDQESSGHVDAEEETGILSENGGKEFGSLGEAYAFYQEYGKSTGFKSSIQNSRKSKKTGEVIDAKFACTRYGTNRSHPGAEIATCRRSCIKTGCKAFLHVKNKLGKWIIHGFEKRHNHELLPAAEAVSEQTQKMFAANATQFAQYKKSAGHGLNTGARSSSEKARVDDSAMEPSEANCLLDFFTEMQSLNTNFFYAVNIGEDDQQVRSFFWADAKSRHGYVSFSDVVCLESSYVRNRYKMPLVLFVGVNQHYQFLLLGCALVSDETEATYSWVMRTWLKAMGGQAPKVLLTDQEKVFKSIVPEIFPSSSHHFSLWQIMRKVTHEAKQNESFMAKFNKCVFRSWMEEEFERRWLKLVDRFELKENELMQSLYEDRAKWVPLYLGDGDVFLAGMSTVNRSESVTSYFDRFLHEKTSVQEFTRRYEEIMQDRYEEEGKADSDTWNKHPALKSQSPFEKQLATIYTHAVFKRFQVEVLGAVACIPKREMQQESSSSMITFRVMDFQKNDQDFAVTLDELKSEVSCMCHLFEYRGYLCRHALIVLQSCGISTIPDQYILRRWSKDAKNGYSVVGDQQLLLSRVQRYNELCRRAMQLGEEGSLSEERYNLALQAIDGALTSCRSVNMSSNKNPAQAVKKRKQDNLSSSSRPINFDGSFGPCQGVPGMVQLNSMAPTRDNMYANQQSMQGLGQLNTTVAPSPDSFHGTSQQPMHGLGQMDFF